MTAAPARNALLGFPKGAWLIVGVEFWERFSFYGMLAILVLFLTAGPAAGGFGWTDMQALGLVGLYSGAMYALPAVGGYVADRVIGRRRAVTIGASAMLLGQLLLAAPFFVPLLMGALYDVPMPEAVRGLGQPLGWIAPSAAIDAAIAAKGVAGLRETYTLIAWAFHAAIACLILGNALMKSTLVVLCGETFAVDDPRRDGAYAYYYLGIAVGAMLSGFVVGSVADRFGWHYGFLTGALGIAISLTGYTIFAARWLGDIGSVPDRPASRQGVVAPSLRARDRQRLLLVFLLSLLLCVFSIGWFQLFGSWSLFIERSVDRRIGGFVMPVPWLSSINAAVVIASAPLVGALLVRLAKAKAVVDIVHKYAFALAMAAGGNALLYWSATHAGGGALAPLWPSLVGVALLGIGEIVAWTSTYGIVTRAAPEGYASATMGGWYLMTLGLGGYLSGFAGRLVEPLGYAGTFLAITVMLMVVLAVALMAGGALRRLAARAAVDL